MRSECEGEKMAIKSHTYMIPLVLLLIFIGFGDKFLPTPLNNASAQTRATINKWIIGLFPQQEGEGINPNKQREEQIEKLEGAK
jgi:hypothetical protein